MRYRRLGQWGIKVSEIGLGSWLTFGGSVDEQRSIDCIHRALDLGVNFFDTANVYAEGHSEEVVGKALAGIPRDRYVLATKVYFPMGDGPNERGLSRKHVTEECHASLRRLGVDYVDLFQCHRFDTDTPLEETCRTMDDLIRRGDVLYWGVSEWTADQMRETVELCRREHLHPPVSDQPRYSMLERGAEEDVLPTCAELGIGVVVFSPLAQGVLTGKYDSVAEAPTDSRAAHPVGGTFIHRLLSEQNLARVGRLRPIAQELGLSLAQLALAWVLRRSEVSSAIVGATKLAHVDENVRAFGVGLEADVQHQVERALD